MKSKRLLSLMMLCFACFGVAKAQQSLPYSYGFEDNDLSVDGWTTQNPSELNASEFGIIGSAAQNGSYGFRFSSYSDMGESTQYLISPELNAPRGVVVQFSYRASSSYTSGETFQVGYSTTDTDITSFTFGTANNATNTAWAQTEEMILPAGTKYVAVYYSANYQYRLYVDDFTFANPPACIPATNLAVTTDGQTATATWDGTAANDFIVTVNGVAASGNQTSPYTFNVNLSTTYEIVVTADCGADGTSDPVSTSFTTPDCIGGRVIEYTLNDSYGDGWNGNAIQVVEGCGDIIATLTIENGYSNSGTLTLCGDQYQFVWVNGLYAGETSFTFTEGGTTLFTKPSSVSDGLVLYTIGTYYSVPTALTASTPGTTEVDLTWTAGDSETSWQLCVNGDENNLIYVETRPSYTLNRLTPDTDYTVKVRAYIDATTQSCWTDEITVHTAEACTKPTNLAEANISFTTADLSWQGTSDSYVLQYRTAAHDNMNLWEQVGNDIIGTGTLTQYTFDLSDYSGNGSIAIRHYNVSDMFRVAIDDIVVTDARGQEVVNEGFETSVPSDWQAVDYDGDGYNWARVSFASADIQNGDYCMSSESWNQSVGALTPDNWLIIPDVELGGTLTFYMRGVDVSFPQENIGVFVTTASLDDVFSITPAGEWSADITTTANSYELTGLTANTEYEWQVKGICGDTESGWASSSFSTIAEGIKTFVTAGDWDVAANWFPVGVPAITDEVSIEAAATIPAGVLATAKRVDLNGGSILIKDGGQLKQGAATLRVTMEKEIAGYGEDLDKYYFISSPFSGRTLYQESGTWSRVDNLFDGAYDLYAFDATAEDGFEWINYKSSPTHISFQSDNGNAGLMYGEGYLYANEEGTTLTFVGTTGKSVDYSETIDYTFDSESTDEWNGWKLVGNYFSCNAYINYVDANGNVLDADFYTLNLDNTYSLMSSNQPLAPCTGALINYSATGKVQYSTEPTNSKGSMLNMTVSEGRSTVDQVRVRFGQGHNLKHMSFRNSSKLYMPVEGNDFAVVYAENEGEMPVNFKAEKNGTYTLSFNTENVEFGYLHLIDNMTGADVDLLSTPSYSFEASVTDYASRFRLVFATGNDEDSFAFFSNGSLFVNNEGNATVQVIDVTGRIVKSESINGSANVNFDAAPGVYMVRLVNGDNMKVQKVVK